MKVGGIWISGGRPCIIGRSCSGEGVRIVPGDTPVGLHSTDSVACARPEFGCLCHGFAFISVHSRPLNPTKRKAPDFTPGLRFLIGQRPTLPHTRACSTIGAEGLNFRVRDGNGWDPFATITQRSKNLRNQKSGFKKILTPDLLFP